MDTDAPARQTGSRWTTDLKRGDTVQLTIIMLQTKYQINPTYTSGEIFDEKLSSLKIKQLLGKQEVDRRQI